jgi:hypothetical protein
MQRMAHQESALRKKSERKGGGKQSEADRKGRKIEAGGDKQTGCLQLSRGYFNTP